MASQVENGEMAAAIDQIVAGVTALRRFGVSPADAADAVTCIAELEQLNRLTDSLCVDLFDDIDKRRLHLSLIHI